MEFSLYATVLNKTSDKFLLFKTKPVAAGENGGQHHRKIDADGSLYELLGDSSLDGCQLCNLFFHSSLSS